jgi:hypothetical protein
MMRVSLSSSSYWAKKWTDSPGISTRRARTGSGVEGAAAAGELAAGDQVEHGGRALGLHGAGAEQLAHAGDQHVGGVDDQLAHLDDERGVLEDDVVLGDDDLVDALLDGDGVAVVVDQLEVLEGPRSCQRIRWQKALWAIEGLQ